MGLYGGPRQNKGTGTRWLKPDSSVSDEWFVMFNLAGPYFTRDLATESITYSPLRTTKIFAIIAH